MSVNLRTLLRFIKDATDNGRFHDPQGRTIISDDELKELISALIHHAPAVGQATMWERLERIGVFVARDRVRKMINAVSPDKSLQRLMSRPQRRKYQVSRANALWHIDGNHKLIKWKIVTHVGVYYIMPLMLFLFSFF